MQGIEITVFNAVKDTVIEKGYELVAVKYATEYGTPTLTVIIFKKGDMGHDDCEKVFNAIDPIVDTIQELGDKPYNLNVSSMGLDWKLVTDDDYRRRMDEEVEVFLSRLVEGESQLAGILKSFDAQTVTLDAQVGKKGAKKVKTVVLNRADIVKAQPYIKF